MIVSRESAYRIWMAHREIETGEKLLAEMRETIAKGEVPTPVERGTHRSLQLGVPQHGGYRLFDVAPDLAIRIIEAHIADKRRELNAASIDALRELEHRP